MELKVADRDEPNHSQFPHLSSSILDLSCNVEDEKYRFQDALSLGSFQPFYSRPVKKRRVPSACIPCKLSRAKCSDARPCSRCVHNKRSESCIDGPQNAKVAFDSCLNVGVRLPPLFASRYSISKLAYFQDKNSKLAQKL
jgi:hypothetical protein